jgi:thioredoxin-dependent peroxiredoxin
MSEPKLHKGDPAPGFTLTDDRGATVSLDDFSGRRVVVYFYPAALTSGCTIQARDFRDNQEELNAADVAVLGISRDTPEKLAEFRAAEQLDFPLLSDPDKQVHLAYGTWGEKVVNGETKMGVIRSRFVIGDDGTIESADYGVTPEGGAAAVLATLNREV